MNTSTQTTGLRRYATILVALAVVAAFGVMARFPTTSKEQAAELASHFRFSKSAMPEVPNHPAYKGVREVHPSLKRIASWISSLGAAVTLSDLDGDGLPNDLIHIDPRTDLVTVAPAPGTGNRYQP